jgi:hypothetical protein
MNSLQTLEMLEMLRAVGAISKTSLKKALSAPRLHGNPKCPCCGKGYLVERINSKTGGAFVGCSLFKRGCVYARGPRETQREQVVLALSR